MNDLKEIKIMLEALLRSNNHIHWIGGYVYGRTSNDDPFIILYPSSDLLQEKACRVYPQDFKKLPAFIPTDSVPTNAADGNPNKQKAQQKRVYHTCPAFMIVTYDGKDTQMGKEKRFGGVVRLSREAREFGKNPPASRPPQPPPPTASPPVASPPVASPEKKTVEPFTRAEQAVESQTLENFVHYSALHFRGLQSLFTDIDRVQKIVDLLLNGGGYDPRHNESLLMGLVKYDRERQKLEQAGTESVSAHNTAIYEAITDYKNRVGGM